jgi:hypothetical protein
MNPGGENEFMSLSRRRFLALSGTAAAAAPIAARPSSASASTRPRVVVAPFNPARWKKVFVTDFPVNVPLGQFPKAVTGQWGAYPHGWPDTATQRGLAVGGIYDPESTTWIKGGYLHVRQWRGASGPVHCSTPYPKAANGVLYGRFVEVTRVSHATIGYKSAHMLWPSQSPHQWEIDWPENNWTGIHSTPHGFDHYDKTTSPRRLRWPTSASWTAWHTYEIRWKPSSLELFLDGARIGHTTRAAAIPHEHMSWRLQNESALIGTFAAPSTSAQIDTAHVEYWSWTG